MKSLKEFLNIKENTISENIEESSIIEAKDHPLFEHEEEGHQNHHHPMDPPAILIMRRKSVRQFPNNQRVALYYVDKINKYVTVPYTAMQWTSLTPESYNCIQNLNQIIEHKKEDYIVCENGEKVEVTVEDAQNILKMYSQLNEENKVKLSEMVNKSKEHFSKVVNFAINH